MAVPPVDIETRTIRKLRMRIIPFVFVLMVIAFLDRINEAFICSVIMRPVSSVR